MEEMYMAAFQDKEMVEIPKKYKKTAVAAYNTVPEAEEFAEELSKETGYAYGVTVDNQSGTAVVQMEMTDSEDGISVATEYGYIPFGDFGLEGAKDVSSFGNGNLVDLFLFCPKPVKLSKKNKKNKEDYEDEEDEADSPLIKAKDELLNLLEEAERKCGYLCYAVIFMSVESKGEYLVAFKKSAFQTADGQEFKEGMNLYRDDDNDVCMVDAVKYRFFRPEQEAGEDSELLFTVFAPHVVLSDSTGNTETISFDFQYSVDRSYDTGWSSAQYCEPVLFKTTLWKSAESRQAHHAEAKQRKRLAKLLRKRLNKAEICLHKTVIAAVAVLGLFAAGGIAFCEYRNQVVDTKDITVTACSSSRQYTNAYGTICQTYKLTEKDGTEAYFVFKDGQGLMDIPADNTVTVTINTRRNGKKTVSYNGEDMYRVEFTD